MTRRPAQPVTTLSGPRTAWVSGLLVAASQLWLGVSHLTRDTPSTPGLRWVGWLAIGVCCWALAWAWWVARERVHMTSDGVSFRSPGRRTIAWQDVQGIELVRRRWRADVLRVTPKEGAPVKAMLRRSWLDDSIERHHRVLQQWWRSQAQGKAREAACGTADEA